MFTLAIEFYPDLRIKDVLAGGGSQTLIPMSANSLLESSSDKFLQINLLIHYFRLRRICGMLFNVGRREDFMWYVVLLFAPKNGFIVVRFIENMR